MTFRDETLRRRRRVPSAQELGLRQPTFLRSSLPYKVSPEEADSGASGLQVDVQSFSTPGAGFEYVKPQGAYRFVAVILQGGGGGGGSGALDGSGLPAGGGGGGGGGGRAVKIFEYGDVDAVVQGAMGPIGTGGDPPDSATEGNDGLAGGEVVVNSGLPQQMSVSGGGGGGGGTFDAGGVGGVGGAGEMTGGIGGVGGFTAAGSRPASPALSAGAGGGGGGGCENIVSHAGGQGADVPPWLVPPGDGGFNPSGAGGAGNATYEPFDPGTGGGGGGGASGDVPDPGGTGGVGGAGSGGGGGGAGTNTNADTSGAGGDGGPPFAVFVAIP